MNEPCPLDTVFHETVMDYFSRMGGAGQWMVPNYQDWYPVDPPLHLIK